MHRSEIRYLVQAEIAQSIHLQYLLDGQIGNASKLWDLESDSSDSHLYCCLCKPVLWKRREENGTLAFAQQEHHHTSSALNLPT